jgi:hypothetical protein
MMSKQDFFIAATSVHISYLFLGTIISIVLAALLEAGLVPYLTQALGS